MSPVTNRVASATFAAIAARPVSADDGKYRPGRPWRSLVAAGQDQPVESRGPGPGEGRELRGEQGDAGGPAVGPGARAAAGALGPQPQN
ncbi:hypothetical protein AB0M92_36375 [Streptomyces sp. NPDC051582]|uniref:hypothetical protein n=1 Tax=Streptomyces sp. NPDC051582 TaxID=3155167 RepID=UPI0034131B93